MGVLFIMTGLSFSGKTTLAKRISEATGASIVSYDDLYEHAPREDGLAGMDEYNYLIDLMNEHARARLSAGESVIVDNLNEDLVDRDRLRATARAQGAKAIVVFVDTPLAEIHDRRRRNDLSGERGLTPDHQFEFVLAKYEPPPTDETTIRYTPDDNLVAWLNELRRQIAPEL